MSTQPEPTQPVTDAGGPVTDGPNTHHYWTATHIWSWTIVDLDDVDGTTHHFHVPTAIADLLRSETTAAARAEVARQVAEALYFAGFSASDQWARDRKRRGDTPNADFRRAVAEALRSALEDPAPRPPSPHIGDDPADANEGNDDLVTEWRSPNG